MASSPNFDIRQGRHESVAILGATDNGTTGLKTPNAPAVFPAKYRPKVA
jgi:hypothetical protein